MLYRDRFKGSGRSPSPHHNSYAYGRSEIARYLLKKALALSGLFILLTGCLYSEPVEKETISLRMDTPSAGWTLAPLEVWETEQSVYCLFQLTPPQGMSAQVISSVVSEMQIPATEKPKKRVVLGKTWRWSSPNDIEFPESLQGFRSRLPKGAKRVEFLPPDA